jgi:predicted ribosome quality control (RQC) complex YloA/Tae2 family protein
MSLKWKEISRLVEEARPLLMGSAVQKIAQVKEVAGGDSFVLLGFGGLGAWRLWACLQQDQSCWVLADRDWELESQPEPSTFVMVLRKHCVGKKVVSLEQPTGERLVLLHLEGGISLVFELLPKRANILLVDGWDSEQRTGRCLQSFRQVSLEAGGLVRLREPPTHAGTKSDEPRDFEVLSEGPYPYHSAVGEFFWGGVQKSGFASYKRLWRQAWKSQAKKINNALTKTKVDLEESKEAELFQKRGMALVSNLYALGPKTFPKEKEVLIDGLQIPLDPAKNFSDNAEACFRKAKKMHRAVGELESRVVDLEKKAAANVLVAEKIEKAAAEDELEALASAFEGEGVEVPERPSGLEEKKSAPVKKLCLEATSTDGFLIYCGRNQEENRQVTFREAKGNDIWLHVKGVPGAHVVVKAQKNKTVPLSTLLEAAQLCLYYTKIRKGKRAEVDYTHRKNVKAIKGTIAEVTYTGNKSLYVEADPDSLKRLLRNG